MNSQTTVASIACILFFVGCASAHRPPSGHATCPCENEKKVAAAEKEITRLEADLTLLKAEAKPDCMTICGLVTNICDLANRICDLAKQDSTANLGPRCQDATLRCERAPKSTATRCDCQAIAR
jgi:hypothetical protein